MSWEELAAEVICYWMEKSSEALESARSEQEAGRRSFAVNRAYYACFCPEEAWVVTPEGWKREDGRPQGLWGVGDKLVKKILSGRPPVLKKGCLIDSLPPQGVHVYADIAP